MASAEKQGNGVTEKGSLVMYLFNLTWVTVLLNLLLFPGLSWLFYRTKETIGGEVVASEIFFGGLVCTLVVGTTGHLETAKKVGGCFACKYRGNCPFLGIFLLGIGFGVVCGFFGHLFLGSEAISFKTMMWVKVAQALFLGLAIPQAMVWSRLLLHPEVEHGIPCPIKSGAE